MPNAKERQRYNYLDWCEYLKHSVGKNLEYNEDYYKYLRGMTIIRELEDYEQAYLYAYDYIMFNMKGIK